MTKDTDKFNNNYMHKMFNHPKCEFARIIHNRKTWLVDRESIKNISLSDNGILFFFSSGMPVVINGDFCIETITREEL